MSFFHSYVIKALRNGNDFLKQVEYLMMRKMYFKRINGTNKFLLNTSEEKENLIGKSYF